MGISTNEINQYTARAVTPVAHLLGTADESATVTVNAEAVTRQDAYWYKDLEVANTTSAAYPEVEIAATYLNLFTSVTGRVFVAETPEAFQYDSDGNLTQDGRFAYTWDAENRLVGVTTRNDLPPEVPRVKVAYLYDHQSRRIASATAVRTNATWQATESRAFIYDGWNVVQETINHQPSTTNYYTWGLDLSGSLQGAGGIGGLLSASLDGTTAHYCYDANGNVGQLVGPDGELLAHYEYSPFGESIVATGPLAKATPFRFSTKHWHNLTGLGYWGYRWYSPGMGKWFSRDPIGERGGSNLFGYALNAPAYRIDKLGQTVVAPVPEIKIPEVKILPANWSDGFTCAVSSTAQWFCKNCAWVRPGGRTAMIAGYCSTCFNGCTAWCLVESTEQDAIEAGFDLEECKAGCKARQAVCIGSGCNMKF